MNQETARKILDIQDAVMEDGEYQALLAEYDPIHRRFSELLRNMDPVHRGILMDYLGVTASMHLRLLELAVER